MHRKTFASALLDLGLGWLMAMAGIGCLATGFHMDVDLQIVAMVAAIVSLLAILFARLKRGWLGLLLTILAGLLLLSKLDFAYNLFSTLRHIWTLYERGYGWDMPEFLLDYEDWDLTLTMAALAGICSLLAGLGLSNRRHGAAILAVLAPILPCIALTDTVPDAPWLLLAILTLALLALTGPARKINTRQANRLTALLLIPVMLSGCLLFTYFPRDAYTPPDISQGFYALMDKIAMKLPFLNQVPGPNLPVTTPLTTVELGNTGPRPGENRKVMEVIASRSGVIYLRGRSYVNYSGKAWAALETAGDFPAPNSD